MLASACPYRVRFSTATCSQIVKCCQHYEERASGSYSPSSPAARYLYDLSRDVQDLVRVLKLQEDGLAARVRELEHLLRDWHAVFGAPDAALTSLGISGGDGTNTPHHVARALKQLRAALEDERAKHAPTDGRHAHEVAELRAALRDSSRVGREQASYEVATLQAAARAAVEEERTRRTAAEAALKECRASIAAAVAAQVEEKVAAVQAKAQEHAAAADAEHAAAVGALQAELQLALRRAGAADAEAESLRRATQRQQEAAASAVAALKAELDRTRAEADSDAQALRARLVDQDEAWARALADRDAAWRATDSVVRAAAQDERIAFLTRRLEELERLAEAMQLALLSGSSQDGRTQQARLEEPTQQQRTWCGGALTSHTSGDPAALLAAGGTTLPPPSSATARHTGVIDVLARVKHSGATASASSRGAVVETQYYAVVA
jgi:hypothetical protein